MAPLAPLATPMLSPEYFQLENKGEQTHYNMLYLTVTRYALVRGIFKWSVGVCQGGHGSIVILK